MRTALIVFGVIAMVAALLAGGLLLASNLNDASGMSDVSNNPFGSMVRGMFNLPSRGDFLLGAGIAGLLVVSCIFGIVSMFLKNEKAGIAGAVIVALAGALIMILQPSVPFANPDPGSVGTVAGLLGVIAGGCIFGVHRTNRELAAHSEAA